MAKISINTRVGNAHAADIRPEQILSSKQYSQISEGIAKALCCHEDSPSFESFVEVVTGKFMRVSVERATGLDRLEFWYGVVMAFSFKVCGTEVKFKLTSRGSFRTENFCNINEASFCSDKLATEIYESICYTVGMVGKQYHEESVKLSKLPKRDDL